MKKISVAFVATLLLAGSAFAADWNDGFKACDSNNSGTISSSEWTGCESKLDPQMNPTFATMDTDHNNSVDEAEWSTGAKMKTAIGNNCREANSSWCPCQNHPEKPECQKSN